MKQEEYKALVQAARETDLVAYFQRNGFTVERKGSEYYVKEYPSFCIKPSTNQRYFHYTREGATNHSINCLTKVRGMDFNIRRGIDCEFTLSAVCAHRVEQRTADAAGEMHLFLQRQNAIHDNRYRYGRSSYLLDAEGAVWYNGMETKKTA